MFAAALNELGRLFWSGHALPYGSDRRERCVRIISLSISISWLKITECAHEDEKQAECTSMRLLTDPLGCNVPLRSRLLGESAGGVMTMSIFAFSVVWSTAVLIESDITVKSTHGELLLPHY